MVMKAVWGKSRSKKSIDVFISYAHEDGDLCRELEKHLSLLKQQKLINVWYDRDIRPGIDWEQAVSTYLDRAQIILLLISPDFMASSYCYGKEMMKALEKHQEKKACVIPIILRPTDWEGAPFSNLQALPTDAIPIKNGKWHTQDEAFVDIIKGLRKILQDFMSGELSNAPFFVAQKKQGEIHTREQIGGYRIEKELGRGTYGTVYLARDLFAGRFVALKLMHAEYSDSVKQREVFQTESRILGPLHHPHILSLLTAGSHDGK